MIYFAGCFWGLVAGPTYSHTGLQGVMLKFSVFETSFLVFEAFLFSKWSHCVAGFFFLLMFYLIHGSPLCSIILICVPFLCWLDKCRLLPPIQPWFDDRELIRTLNAKFWNLPLLIWIYGGSCEQTTISANVLGDSVFTIIGFRCCCIW